MFSLFLDGKLPDVQAQIKAEWKPKPTKMLEEINKWMFITTLVGTIYSMTFFSLVNFFWEHLLFTFDMFVYSFLSLVGQFFIYRLIKHFKQHIAPFVTTIRKILTVVISLVYYGHPTNWVQIFGLVIVLPTVALEFMI